MSDNWYETKDHGFRQDAPGDETLEVVGNCTKCGAPIYGKRHVGLNEFSPARYSCWCWYNRPPGASAD